MMLGDILAASRRAAPNLERWLAETDPERAARLRQAAAAIGETPFGYLRLAVAEFEGLATEEDWASLTSRLRCAEAPGTEALAAMLDWRLGATRHDRLPNSQGAVP